MPRKGAYGKRPRRAKVGRKTKVSKPIKTYVKRMISRKTEEKRWLIHALNQNVLTVANSTPTNVSLLPVPNQGTGDSDRIGNEIIVKKASIRGFVNLSPYNSSTNPNAFSPVWVKMWIVSAKNINTNNFTNTLSATSFFRANNTSINFQATIRDQLYPVNIDLFTVHKTKSFKLGAGSTSDVVQSGSYFDNSPMSAPFVFDLSKYVNKLMYDENQTFPTNKNLFLVITASRCDGGTSSASNPLCEYHYLIDYEYQDA